MKELAPSNELRKWFRHEPEKFKEFTKLYLDELEYNQEAQDTIQKIIHLSKENIVILLYGSRNTQNNHAVVLKEYLESKMIDS